MRRDVSLGDRELTVTGVVFENHAHSSEVN